MKVQQLDSKFFLLIKNIRIAVLILGTAILFYACKDNNIEKIQAFTSPEDLPIQEAINFENLSTDSGVVRFSLKTPKLLRFENEGKAYLEFPIGVKLIEYDADQNITYSITADYAKQFIKEGKWEAKNNVIVTNAQGDSLKTEHLIWEEKTEKIYTEEFVKIIRDNQEITGVGLVSDQNMLNWKIKHPQGTLYIDVETKNEPQATSNEIMAPPEKYKARQPETQTLQFK
jgi:LPS export ABC transporter protein LptC